MGATVLHEDAVFPVRRAGIPTNIRNTNAPDDPGTMIVCDISSENEMSDTDTPITGIAGHTGFTILSIEKAMMNSELGVGRRVLSALEEYGVCFEHLPTGIDTMCVVINDNDFNIHQEELLNRIRETVEPDVLELKRNLAIIATVGRGMAGAFGTAAKLFTALAESRINVRMIDQGSSELNIIVGVDMKDGAVAVNGWKEVTPEPGVAFCRRCANAGVKAIIATDISRDGTMQGTNMDLYRELLTIPGLEITASGGIAALDELAELQKMHCHAAILGKSIYTGAIDLAQAVRLYQD